MSETNTPSGLSGGKIALIVLGILMLIGLFSGGGKSTPPATGSSYTPTTSSWCEDHAQDEWNGKYDAKMQRYIKECTNK